jgi:VCBS repeat-containing protein
MKLRIKPIVAACALAVAAGQAGAVDFYLATKAYTKTLPDGSTVPMWGYVIDPDLAGDLDGDGDPAGPEGDCYETTPASARVACIDALAAPTGVVGPRLTIPSADSTFRIFLTNGLPEPTSIVIPGQEMPHSALLNGVPDNGPTWNDGSRGARGADLSKKLRSYGREANANGGRRAFVWRNSRNNPITETGTLIYHTGTWPQKQLYMGLYGLVTKDASPGVVYDLDPVNTGDEVTYGSDTTLFYSDIDPAFNAAVAAGTLETAIERHPSWFLVNGEPYVAGATPDITGLATNQPNLIRFASAASEKHVPVLQGLYATIHGEDGMQYTWQDGATGVATPAPIQQYSVGLPPLKTKDVIVNPAEVDRYAVYDGNGYMTNPSDPTNEDPNDIDSLGGMLRFLNFAQGANQPPVTVADQVILSIPEITPSTTLPVTVSVAVDVLANDSDLEGAVLGVLDSQQAFLAPGLTVTLTCVNADAVCTAMAEATAPLAAPVTTDMTYTATDNDPASSDTLGTVTINLVQNLAPTVVDDNVAADSDPNNPTLFNVLDNDSDPENDMLTIALGPELLQGAVVCPDLTDGNCTYTPPNGLTAADLPLTETFTYTATDGINPPAGPATVTITVDLTNGAPTAVDDVYQTQVNVALNEIAPGVLGNDTDPNPMDTLTAILDTGPSNAATFVLNADGSFDYTPAADYVGPDSFTYFANDGSNNSATPATVNITVNPDNVAPVATADTYEVNEDAILDVVAPGVLDNDIDADLDPLTAVLVTGPNNARPDPGSFVLNADGSFHYEPDVNFNGTDSFTYMANDGIANSAEVSVTINVIPQNDAPVVSNDVFYLQNAINMVTDGEGQPLTVTFDFAAPGVLANDFDDTAMTATEVNDPDNVTPSLSADGAASVDINNNAVGTLASLQYTATDTSNLVSSIATADFVRLITVTMSEYRLNEDTDPTNDDWRIRGNVDTTVVAAGSQVHAFLVSPGGNEQEIVSNAAGGNSGVVLNNGSFRLYTNNLGPLAHVGETIRVEVRDALGELIPNAVYYNVPVYILP